MSARWFRIPFAESAFRRYLAEIGQPVDELQISSALTAMTGFALATRAQHAAPDGGDALMWQWAPDTDGERFTACLTRQLIRTGVDQPIVQLTLCLRYRWTPTRRALGRGQTWCFRAEEFDAFAAEVRRSPAYRAIAAASPVSVELRTDTL